MLALLPSTVGASETITYGYDAKGRLTQVVHTGGPNAGIVSSYAFDAADNRTSHVVSGAIGAGRRMVVVPLNGLPVIPLPPG